VQRSDQDPLDDGAEQRGEDKQYSEQADQWWPSPLHGELPVGERTDHADGAVREIEDA
jgi:hypothetical protein